MTKRLLAIFLTLCLVLTGIPMAFAADTPTVGKIDLSKATFTATSSNWGSGPASVADGNAGTYWNSTSHGEGVTFSETLSVDLNGVYVIDHFVFKVPSHWADRTQTVNITGSLDGLEYNIPVATGAKLVCEAATGNTYTLQLENPVSVQYMKLEVTASTNHEGRGQIGEWEMYGSLDPDSELPPQNEIRVALVGDSITYGSGASSVGSTNYAALVKKQLGSDYLVGNFGRSGATGTMGLSASYNQTGEYRNSQVFNPDVVTIMLGTNDAKTAVWNAESYERDLPLLVQAYRDLPSKPMVILATSPMMTPSGGMTQWGENTDEYLAEVVEIQRRVAKKLDCPLIDTYAATKNWTINNGLSGDGVHPNDAGHTLLADLFANGIVKALEEDTDKPTIEKIDLKAAGAKMNASSIYAAGYTPELVIDGDSNTFWNSTGHGEGVTFSETLIMDMRSAYEVSYFVFKVPARWDSRTQTAAITGSMNGLVYDIPVSDHVELAFDKTTGNTIMVRLDKPVCARYLRLEITASTNAEGRGQIGEWEVYGYKNTDITFKEKTKIVCVGDSITYGDKSTDRSRYSYPSHLQQLLGDEYEVNNHGRNGASMGEHDRQYTYLEEQGSNLVVTKADIEAADVVIIMLGTNDAGLYWDSEGCEENYLTCYKKMIDHFKEWNPDLQFILATPATGCDAKGAGWLNPKIKKVTDTLIKFYEDNYADDDQFSFIDVNANTAAWNGTHNDWYADNVHFTDFGYYRLANMIYEELKTVIEIKPGPSHVAIVGDSIAYGLGADELGKTNFAALVKERLGSGYMVGNFSKPNAVCQTGFADSYTATIQYKDSLSFAPKAVAVMMGVGDLKTGVWDAEQYETDLTALLQSYLDLPCEPHVFAATLPMMKPTADATAFGDNTAEILEDMVGIQRRVANALGCTLIDAYAATADWTVGKGLSADGIHPDNGGHTQLAELFIAAITSSVEGTSHPLEEAPPTPTISKFGVTAWDTGWYHVETDLQIGDSIYTFDYNTTGNEVKTENPDDYRIKTVPSKFIGCDFIVTRRKQRKQVNFLAERDIDVYAAIDTAYGTGFSWESGWTRTNETLTTNDGTEYVLYRRSYKADQQVSIRSFGSGDDAGRNLFYMILPTDGVPIWKELTKNPVLPEGTKSDNTTEKTYQYYLNDVYNTLKGNTLPDGYATTGNEGTASVLTTKDVPVPDPIPAPAAGTNMALGCTFEVSADTWHGESPVDGDPTTYWRSQRNLSADSPAILTVDLKYAWKINQVKLKLWPRWGDRVQRLEIQGSTDNRTFTTLVAATDYTFVANDNVVTIPVPETAVRYIRVVGYSNTGDPCVQIGELEVYGPKQDVETVQPEYDGTVLPERVIKLEKTAATSADWGVIRTLDTTADGRIVVETRVKPSTADQKTTLSLKSAAGSEVAALVWDTDGKVYAVANDKKTALTTYTANKWTTVKLVLNFDDAQFDVWVDHLLKGDDLALMASADLMSVAYLFDGKAVGSLQVDYLRVCDDTEIYAYAENFNTLATGSLPDGWNCTDADAVKVAEVPFAENKSLQISGTGIYAVRDLPSMSGYVTVEAMIKAENDNWVTAPLVTDANGRVVAKVAFYKNSVFVSDGNNWAYLCDQVMHHAYYESGNWYQIRLVMNTDTNRYDVYVDGAKRYENASFVEEVDAIERITFGVEQKNTLYVDDIRVYNSASLDGGLMPGPIFNVKDYGAKGDGKTDDTAAIAEAIKAAAGTGGTVLLEDGVFCAGQITLASDITFFVAPDATISADRDRHAYDKVIPSNGYNGNRQLGRGVVYFDDAKNVTITGGGTINGNGFYAYGENDPGDQRPCLVYFTQSENVTLENVHLINSAFWTVVPYESVGVSVRNVDVSNPCPLNRDGVDPVNTSYITIENCCIIAGDDAICPKSGNQIDSAYLEVRNCLLQSDCNGIKIGTDTQGPFHDMLFEDIRIKRVGLSGLTIQSVDGSDIERIVFRRIDMNDVDNGLFICIGNRYRMPIPAGDTKKKLGNIRDIVFEDVNFTNPMMAPYNLYGGGDNVHEMMVVGLNPKNNTIADGEDHYISDILFKNVYVEMPGGFATIPNPTPGISNNYPEHNSLGASSGWAYTLRWTHNVRFVNCTSVQGKADVRPEIAILDSTENTAQKALMETISEVLAICENEGYQTAPEAVKAAVEKTLNDAFAVYEDNNAVDADVQAANAALVQVLRDLGESVSVDKSALNAEIEEAEKVGDLAGFMPATAEAFEKALTKAKAVAADENATQIDVNLACEELKTARESLVEQDSKDKVMYFDGSSQIWNQLLYGTMFYTDWKPGDPAPVDFSGTAANGANNSVGIRAKVTFTALHDGVDLSTAWTKIGFRLRSSWVDGAEKAAAFYNISASDVTLDETGSFEVMIPLSAITTDNIDWTDVKELNITCEVAKDYRLDGGTGNSPDLTLTLTDVRIAALDEDVIPEPPVVDKAALNKAVADAEAKLTDGKTYTADTLAALNTALQAAKGLPANADQAAVDAAAKTLNDAIAGLKEEPVVTVKKGDVNNSGNVTAEDALMALQAATGKINLTDTQKEAADVDSVAGVQANDALLILQYATKKISSLG